jgi:hypothetical protein
MSQPEIISDQVESAKPRRNLRTVGKAVVSLAYEHSPEPIRRKGEDVIIRRIINSPSFDVRFIESGEDADKALELEKEVWREKNYGDLTEYEKYLPQSRIFAAFEDGKAVGMNRLFAGAPETPPFLESMPIDDAELKKRLIEGGKSLKVEEYGTVAVDKAVRGGRIFMDLCRLAYRDASARGIETWGIIMEPERVQSMNRLMGFTFEQIGQAVDYQGGDCAAHIMHLDDVRQSMQAAKPELYDWFVNQPLKP